MKAELNYKLVGQRIRAIRKKRGMTQERLAELAEISPQHCSGIETGAAKVSLPALVKIANALNASMDELLLDSISAVEKPSLMKEVETVFGDATPDETYLMLAQAKSIKEAVRVKGLLSVRERE
nr:helix-turn-helix transcriptional regulator [uncultured Dysosmobacter sp.]